VNLGTPDSYRIKDVHRYLTEFLTDERVIDYPWLKRQLLVRGLIIPARVRNSANSYKAIWQEEGSPLMIYGGKVEKKLQEALGEGFEVRLAMRYQNPSIESAMRDLEKKNLEQLIILPLFPQYASASTGSAHQEVLRRLSTWNVIPEVNLINSYPTQPKMIAAFCERAKQFPLESYEKVVMSFHGLPIRQLIKADKNNVCQVKPRCCENLSEKNFLCYGAQSYATAKAIAGRLGLKQYDVAFQSRLGKDPWIGPFTSDLLESYAKEGVKKVLVFCPAFVCDCLETIFEISVEYKEEFQKSGGEVLDLVPGLNDHPLWIEALKDLVFEHSSQLALR